jgi:RimJ/RimL family protein N-acetyltransferase
VRKLVPDDFAIPAGVEHDRFHLRMLSIDDVVKDFDAICDRVDRDGTPEPPFVSTVAENLVDLGWHQKEFELRRSFAYTLVAPDDSQVLGCAYINPSETHDASVWMWVRRTAWQEGLDPVVEAALRDWLAEEWPFQAVDWGDRHRPSAEP